MVEIGHLSPVRAVPGTLAGAGKVVPLLQSGVMAKNFGQHVPYPPWLD